MTDYSDNLSQSDVLAVLSALPAQEITGDEVALLLAEIASSFSSDPMGAAGLLGQAVVVISMADEDDAPGVLQ